MGELQLVKSSLFGNKKAWHMYTIDSRSRIFTQRPGMIQEPELEEGEACYYKDDTTTDPDTALSYIGDKVQSILGHLQKDFEGGVSAENLGSKFGGYGSFLPMYQRSPSIWSQPKSPQKVQNPSFSTSPNHSFSEGPSTQKNNSEDSSIRQNGPLASHQVELPSIKSGNKTQHRALKVRIKVGPERMEQYNAEIHNLGLTSPSSSAGNSPLESPSESPADILQIMTSFPVSGGLLLSPLCEDLLNLTRKIESSLENKHEAACKSSAISVRILSNDVHGGKKAKPVDKSGTFYKSENGSTVDFNNRKQNNLESEIPECRMQPSHDLNCKPLSNIVTEEKDVLLKKKKESKGSVKGKTVSGKYDYEASLDHGSDSRITSNKNRTSFESYSDISEGERVKRGTYSPSLKVNLKANSGKQYRLGTPHEANKSPFGGEKRSKGSQSSEKLTSKVTDSSTGDGKKGVQRVHLSKKSLVDTSLEHNKNPKKSNNDTAKAKLSYGDKLKGKSSDKKYFVNGLDQPMVAPLVIQEDWVGCDRCEKWRLLPFGTKSEQLPEKWVCSMLDWLPGMNRCDVSEDDTSAAVRASHPGTMPENQNNFQAGAHHFDHNNQNFASIHIADQVKKQKLKEKVNMVRMSNPISSSDSKKDLQRRAVKYGSSKEVNQSIAEVHSTVEFNVQHPHTSAVVEKLKKRKNENVIGDDANLRKKSKKEFERVHGRVEKNTSEAAPDADKFDNFGVNLIRNGHSLTNKESVKGGKKQSTRKDRISVQIHLNEQKGIMHDLPDYQPTAIKTFVGREVPAKKRKLKDYEESQHLEETWENNGSKLQERKYSMKDESKDSAFHRDKKSRVTHIEEEFKRSNGGDITKRKVLGRGNKEFSINRVTEKEQQLRKRMVKANLTIEDIDKLRKDLGFEQVSTAATSSRKNRISHMEMKGTPQESVSSSPVRDFRKNDLKDRSCDLPSNYRNSPLVGNEGNVLEKCSQGPSRVILVNRRRSAVGMM